MPIFSYTIGTTAGYRWHYSNGMNIGLGFGYNTYADIMYNQNGNKFSLAESALDKIPSGLPFSPGIGVLAEFSLGYAF